MKNYQSAWKWLLAFCLFFLVLEVGSFLLLKNNFGKSSLIYQQEIEGSTGPRVNSPEQLVTYSHGKSDDSITMLIKRLQDAGITEYLSRPQRQVDLELLHEPKAISMKGKETGKILFGDRYPYNPGVDDLFEKKAVSSGKLVYSQRIIIDANGRRTSSAGSSKPAYNLIFLGCSFTFGEGLDTEDTFPSQIVQVLPEARAFNLGMHGLSPSHILRNINENRDRISNGTDKLPTIIIYTWIDDHIYRAVSTMRYLHRSPDINPEWDPGIYLENGQLRMEKSFFEGLTPHQFYYYLGKLNIVQYSGIDIPDIGKEHFELIAEVINETRKTTRNLIPELAGFVVATYPFSNPAFKLLIPELRARKIDLFDYSDINLTGLMRGYHDLGVDGHPSRDANKIYAHLLAGDLKSRFPDIIKGKSIKKKRN